ncbi:sigma factor [Rhodocytophaga aerolata]|uniref:Sigma factor n=1 Tax=Rhodocytophaga aerolata TaxID=455078 RepID=A0ABT8RKI1_9BACT|nr:sigma factor [Rhodocytophaga aerolata]MDO1451585.1 sigma factor [Rhodocytophaga aerolata]
MSHSYTLHQISLAEQKIVSLLKDKNKEGFELLYDTYSKSLYTLSLHLTSNSSVAEQVMENTFIYIWKNIDSFLPARSSFGVWLVCIVKGEAIKLIGSTKS